MAVSLNLQPSQTAVVNNKAGSHSIGPSEEILGDKVWKAVPLGHLTSAKLHFGLGSGAGGPGMKILGVKTVANKLPESQLSKMAFDRHTGALSNSIGIVGVLSEATSKKYTKLSTEGDSKSPFKKGLPS